MSTRVMGVLLGGLTLLFWWTVAFAHGGGLDSYGCHHDRKAGGYHCHRGPLAGQAFGSKAEMLQMLQKKEKAPQKGDEKK